MIPDHLQDRVQGYVLGELQGDELAAFEVALNRSGELRAHVRDCSESFAALALEAAGDAAAPPQLARAVDQAIRRMPMALGNAEAEETPRAISRPRNGWARHWAWPVAAAFLLMLNIGQQTGIVPWMSHDSGDDEPGAVAEGRSDRQTGNQTHPLRSGSGSPIETVGESSRAAAELAELQTTHSKLAQDYQRLAAEYNELTSIVVPNLASTLVEMRRTGVWSAALRSSANAGDLTASVGLWDRVRGIVPESGVAALDDRWRLSGGLVVNEPVQISFDGRPGVTSSPSNPGTFVPLTQTSGGPLPAYAMAMLNGAEGLGYLDLYNMPAITGDQELRVWLQSEGVNGYTAVGSVPRTIAGGSGAIVFRVPENAGTPTGVIVTIEPRSGATQPGSRVIIHGP